jgi:hypothetical protein
VITNMMNIKSIALLPQMIEMQHETFASYFLTLYLMFGNQTELEEAAINYLWALSHFPDPYIYLLRDKIIIIINLMDYHTRELDPNVFNNPHSCYKCRERIFSALFKMIEFSPYETCLLIDPNQILLIAN